MPKRLEKILLVAEPGKDRDALLAVVQEKDWSVCVAEGATEAEVQIQAGDVTVLVLDLVREDGAALDILGSLQQRVSLRSIPVIVVASAADKLPLMQAMELGVVDFLWRGASALEIQARVGTAIRLSRLEAECLSMQRVDDITGTHNVDSITELLGREFERSRRYRRPISCLLVDIDRFEELENEGRRDEADRILKLTSDALTQTLRKVDEVSRFRNSIFLILLPETDPSQCVLGLRRVRQCISELAMQVETIIGHSTPEPWELSLTAGIATYPDDGLNSSADLVMAAETALYEAKRRGLGETVRADFE